MLRSQPPTSSPSDIGSVPIASSARTANQVRLERSSDSLVRAPITLSIRWPEPPLLRGRPALLHTYFQGTQRLCLEVRDPYAMIVRVGDEQLIAGQAKSARLVEARLVACAVD